MSESHSGKSVSAEIYINASKIGNTNIRSSIVTILDTETGLTATNDSISQVAKAINSTVSNILRLLYRKNPDKPFRGRYIITIQR